MFRRRRHEDAEDAASADSDQANDAAEAAVDADTSSTEEAAPAPRVRPEGPWDAGDEGRPTDERPYLDLGALRIPGTEGMDIRVDVDNASQRPVAVNLVMGQGALQVQAFAAPKSSGLWDDIRAEIADGIAAQKGKPTQSDGPFGPELSATVTATSAEGKSLTQPVRFIGVDGPRWFLRGVLSGKALSDRALADRLLEVFRGIVVVRGPDAMPPREMLPLALPTQAEATEQAVAVDDTNASPENSDDLKPFERGPEITERR